MRAWFVAMIALGCLAAAGCHANTRYAALALEDENRQLEDVIYQQQAELERLARALEACRTENVALRERVGGGGAPPVPPSVSSGAPDTSRPPVKVELPSTPSSQVPDTLRGTEAPQFDGGREVPERLKGPSLQLPEMPDGAPRVEIPGPLPPPAEENPPEPIPAPAEETIPAPEPEVGPGDQTRGTTGDADSGRVVEITLNEPLTGGSQTDPRRGDRGISLVLEPRDAQGRLVRAPAAVAVVVLDPALEGQAARVARWDFTAEQLAPLYRKGHWGEGFHLEMLWPEAPPLHEELYLFVRYVTRDGRKLETRQKIRVAVAGSGRERPNTAASGAPADSDRLAGGWQHKPSASKPAPAEPVRLSARAAASAPPEPRHSSDSVTSPTPPSTPPAAPTARKLARPVWSPERP